MVLQARAEATRRRILDSAVDLFDELGYGETGLADVLSRANVSKGAFYHHFDSKEAVATAIIEDYRRQTAEAARERIDRSAPPLVQLITATFISAEMLQTDKSARIGNQLLQGLSQISSKASEFYREWTTEFVGALTGILKGVGTRDGIDAAEIAEASWAAVLGTHLLASAIGTDHYALLERGWRSILRATLPDHVFALYDHMITRTAAQYQAVGYAG